MTIRPNPLVPAGAVATIDGLLGRMREDSCVIEQRSTDVDATGVPVSGWETVGSALPCQVVAAGRAAVERIFGARFGPETDYVVKFDRDVSILSSQRITVNGKTLQVVSDDDLKSYGFELLVAAKATS